MDIEKLLELVKTIRVSMSVSQSEMAKRVGMSTSFYGMIERGETNVTVKNLENIANALKLNIIDLFNFVI